jgi:hypothetical protein
MPSSETAVRDLSRRQFIGTAAGAALLSIVPAGALAAPAQTGRGAARVIVVDPEVASYLTDLRLGDAAARATAVRQAPLIGTRAIEPLGYLMAGSDRETSRAAQVAMRRIVANAARKDADREAAAAVAALAAVSNSSR